jgi:hypothetical protein
LRRCTGIIQILHDHDPITVARFDAEYLDAFRLVESTAVTIQIREERSFVALLGQVIGLLQLSVRIAGDGRALRIDDLPFFEGLAIGGKRRRTVMTASHADRESKTTQEPYVVFMTFLCWC